MLSSWVFSLPAKARKRRKPFLFRTSRFRPINPKFARSKAFGFCSYKCKQNKCCRICTYGKQGGGGPSPNYFALLPGALDSFRMTRV